MILTTALPENDCRGNTAAVVVSQSQRPSVLYLTCSGVKVYMRPLALLTDRWYQLTWRNEGRDMSKCVLRGFVECCITLRVLCTDTDKILFPRTQVVKPWITQPDVKCILYFARANSTEFSECMHTHCWMKQFGLPCLFACIAPSTIDYTPVSFFSSLSAFPYLSHSGNTDVVERSPYYTAYYVPSTLLHFAKVADRGCMYYCLMWCELPHQPVCSI